MEIEDVASAQGDQTMKHNFSFDGDCGDQILCTNNMF
jgi:hypothetical protein